MTTGLPLLPMMIEGMYIYIPLLLYEINLCYQKQNMSEERMNSFILNGYVRL